MKMRKTLQERNSKQYKELKKALEEIVRLCDSHGENSKQKIKAICIEILEGK